MNFFRKCYCRIFQFIFNLVMPFFPYRDPIILEKMEDIAKILKEKNVNSVLLVTTKGLRSFGTSKPLEESLQKKNIIVSIYEDVVANPTIDNIENALKIYKVKKCGAIIAFGGGSAMDCAKIVGARAVCPHKSVNQMKGLLKIRKKLPLNFAIPTTAGTGSEVTVSAVITNPTTHHKYPINDFCLIPDYAVLDYKTTLTLPKSLTATTGLDALTHAVEAYIGNSRTTHTKKMAQEATRLVNKYLLRAYNNGNDKEARKQMLRAAYCAGIAFRRSYVGNVHAMAHSLGGQYGVPHGEANAILLPYLLDEYGNKIHKKLGNLAKKAQIVKPNEKNDVASRKFILWIKDLNEKMQIPTYIEKLNKKDIHALSKKAENEANPLYPVPVLMDEMHFAKMFKKVLKTNAKEN